MSIVMYKTPRHPYYYYALEIGMPEHPVQFGEGQSPAEAVQNLQLTQYQSAYFGCRGPANNRLCEYFDADSHLVDLDAEEEQEAEEAYAALQQEEE